MFLGQTTKLSLIVVLIISYNSYNYITIIILSILKYLINLDHNFTTSVNQNFT